ncbi:MAG: biotin--[acetyl-CoA-carboxylase] ligase [Clostridiales Family XIII bacterium]|jgi:BirA family biotin operon repressor/biotin-[acetyl-CoA-carboxylase] ligase|nr:biotin--[acetyl-CoA-carboxylase] ligase [Clostridiales Family XIII bacterium]
MLPEEYDEIDSTNDEAKRRVAAALRAGAAEPSPALEALFGTAVAARRQTAGRGRRGRAFLSPGGHSIYISYILRPFGKYGNGDLLTLAAAVAVCRAIERVLPAGPGAPPEAAPRIKWVNDVFLGGKKICGILAEAVSDPGTNRICALVLGIGVNAGVPPEAFPGELQQTAGSLPLPKEKRAAFMAALSEEVFYYSGLCEGDPDAVLGAYRARALDPDAAAQALAQAAPPVSRT